MKKIFAAALAATMSLSLASVAFGAGIELKPSSPTTGASSGDYEMQVYDGTSYLSNKTEFTIRNEGNYMYTYGTDDSKEKDFFVKVKKDDKLRADVSSGAVTVSQKRIDDTTYKLTVKAKAGVHDYELEKFQIEIDVADSYVYYLLGKVAYSDIQQVGSGDRLSATKKSDGYTTGVTGSVFDFDEVLDEETRIRCNDYVDVYFKGNYATDYENLRVITDTIDEVEKYLDDDIDVDYYQFVAAPKFAKAVTVIIDGDKDSFIYEYNKGDITKVDATYTSDGWKFTTKQLGTYFVTEDEYEEGNVEKDEVGPSTEAPSSSAATDDTGKKNPGTGANDMVGAAAAAAVVSLVAAGAVAFKKSSK